MTNLQEKELEQINGGGLILASAPKWGFAGAAVCFIIGLISGAVRPIPCTSQK